jgi:hypothetical protein
METSGFGRNVSHGLRALRIDALAARNDSVAATQQTPNNATQIRIPPQALPL